MVVSYMRVMSAFEHAKEPVRVRLTEMRVPVTSERDSEWDRPCRGVGCGDEVDTWRRRV